MGRSISPRAAYVGLALLSAAGIAFLYAFDPRNPGLFPACPFLGLTGCFCPGCGTLRALHMLFRGDVASAIGYNVLTVLSVPFIAYSYSTGDDEGVQTESAPPSLRSPQMDLGAAGSCRRILGTEEPASRASDHAGSIAGGVAVQSP